MKAMRAAFFLILTISLASCGSKEPAARLRKADPPILTGGWNSWDRPEFTIAAPDNWSPFRRRRIRQDPPPEMGQGEMPAEVGQMMDSFEAAGRAEDDAEIAALAKEGIPLRLYDNSVRALPAETPTQLTVKVTKEGGLKFETEAGNLFNKLNVDKKTQSKIELPVGTAQEYVTETTNRIGDVVHTIVYLLIDGENRYVFTFIATNNASSISQIARPIMETFRIKA